MNRIERSQLFHRLVSAINFGDRRVKGNLSHAQVYELCDLVCDEICNESLMVVSASMTGFSHSVVGIFGEDEPWPDWADPHGLDRDFGVQDEQLTLERSATS